MNAAKAARAWAVAGGRPAVVLGRGQRLPASALGLPIRRRASGGGAVLDGPWLLRAAVRLPRNHPLLLHGPASLARWLGGVHLQWLRAQGIAEAALHEGPAAAHWACFAGRSGGEVMVGGRKLTGIAQAWRRQGVLASTGTLLRPPPWSLLCAALGQPPAGAVALAAGTVTLEECARRAIDAADWAHSLRAALAAALAASEPRHGA